MINHLFRIGPLFFFPLFSLLAWVDLEEKISPFVLQTKKIEIPEYPEAWNPSIIRWEGKILMSFRVIPNPKTPFTSLLGLVWLDDDFKPIGEAQILNTREWADPVPSRAEDGRLVSVGDQLYFIYSDNSHPKITRGGFRVYVAKVGFENGRAFLYEISTLTEFEGESSQVREKNWIPFEYQESLFLVYSPSPHLILYPIPNTSACQTICSTTTPNDWKWGTLRGGTPALEIGGEYLSFFHSSTKMATVHSEGKERLHYFMGAYTFSLTPPFAVTQISPEPIIGKDFYHGQDYKPYWGSVQVVFPCGYIFDEQHIWVSYGRQDREMWIAKMDKKALLGSLTPVFR